MRTRSPKASLELRVLETRCVPAWTFSTTSNAITITGDTDTDNITVSFDGNGFLTHNVEVFGNLVSALDFNSTLAGEQSVLLSALTGLTINGDAGADYIALNGPFPFVTVNAGDGNDVVYGGYENDTINGGNGLDFLAGRWGNDTINGEADNDTVFGGDGNDIVSGGDGDDVLDSPYFDDGDGTGNNNSADDDVLTGGNSNDVLYGGGGIDTLNGGLGTDTGVDATTGTLVVTDTSYQHNNVELSANHSLESLLIYGTNDAEMLDFSGFTNSVTVYAWGGNDTVIGGPSADQLFGNLGDDSIIGGLGNDTAVGGLGNDTLNGGGGNDLLDFPYIDDGDGSSAENTNGDDALNGDADDDQLYGGAGDDALNGGTGNDYFDDTTDGTLVLTDTSYKHNNVERSANHSLESGVLRGTAGNEVLDASGYSLNLMVIAGDGNDTVTGGSGNDSLYGSGGNDTVLGNGGHDQIIGGPGNDSLDGGNGNDVFDTVYIDDGDGNGGNNGDGNDTISGGDSDDTLYGGPGSDALNGGLGTDYFEDTIGHPKVIFDDVNLKEKGVVRWKNHGLESGVFFGTNGNDSIDASKFTKGGLTIYGFDGKDTIKGGTQNDSLFGNNDNDSLDGGGGADVVIGGTGNDIVKGGLGGDTLDPWWISDGDAFDNTAGNDTQDGGTGDDYLIGGSGDDSQLGGEGDDLIDGSIGANVVDGGKGNDTVNGGTDADKLSGGDGNDVLNGNDGPDTLLGGLGNDTINGGIDNDSLDGGAGNDSLTGNAGADTLVAGAGYDALDGDDNSVTNPFDPINFDLYKETVVAAKPVADTRSQVTDIAAPNPNLQATLTGLAAATKAGGDGWAKTRVSGTTKYTVKLNDPTIPNGKTVTKSITFDGTWSDNDAVPFVTPTTIDFWPTLMTRARLASYSFAAAGTANYDWKRPYSASEWAAANGANNDRLFTAGAAEVDFAPHNAAQTGTITVNDGAFTFAYWQNLFNNLNRVIVTAAPGSGVTSSGIELGKSYTAIGYGIDQAIGEVVYLYNTTGHDQPSGVPVGDLLDDGIIKLTWAEFANLANFASVEFWK